MISLPGLTLTTGRYDIARIILRTFAKYIDKGMLPNVFPDYGETPEYNTVDATLWYFEAIRDLTSYGLRSLCYEHPDYVGIYGGDRLQRDGAYHQKTTWGWLIGHFIQAHLQVYNDPQLTRSFITPMSDHLRNGCLGSISEIFDGDAPFTPRGAFAQAWSVAEVLRAWKLTNR